MIYGTIAAVLMILVAGVAVGLSYFIFRVVARKKEILKRPLFWLLSVLLYPVVFFLSLEACEKVWIYSKEVDFSRDRWVAEPRRRVDMIPDLFESRQLDGLTKDQVIQLLGDPLVDSDYFKASGRDYLYNLGLERSLMAIDDAWLLIWFDSGKVSRYAVMTE